MEKGFQEGHKAGREQARKEALILIADLFRLLARKRFPRIRLGDEVEALGDPSLLIGLCKELDSMPDSETLRCKLAELARKKLLN
ncbi:MAG: hypothetical protein ACREEM_29860 [Blastocatellia bacterium]